MGYKLKRIDLDGRNRVYPNEEKDLEIVLEKEYRSAIHGVVLLPNGRPAEDALVKLFVKSRHNDCELIPVTFTFTDECGQFLFGVEPFKEYVLKVFFYRPERPVRRHDVEEHDER